MVYRQCKFRKGNTYQTAFVEDKPGLSIGSMVELKSDNKTKWEVVEKGINTHLSEMIHSCQL
jgi:hypothetical protein